MAAGVAAAATAMAAAVAVGVAAAFSGIPKQIAQAGDAMNASLAKIESSIGRSATSAQEAGSLYDELYQLGTRTGVSADESAGAFTRFNLAMQDLKRPATDTVRLIEGIQSAGIIAGTSTSELTATMTQLGQALGSGKLQGEELNSLRENMPRFLRDVMAAVDMTSEEFFKKAEKGELTPALLIPAMLKASETARKELANFPVTMARGFSVMTNSANRFLAELDKELGLSKAIASAFMFVARTLDSWRSRISVVGDLFRSLGGLEGMARLAGAALLVAFGPTVLGAVRGLAAAIWMMGRGILTALLPLAGFAAWVLIVEDFIGWMQGKNSLFGEKFGDFETVIQPLRDKIEEFKAWFAPIGAYLAEVWNSGIAGVIGAPAAISDAWNSAVERMRPQFEWLAQVPATIIEVWNNCVQRLQPQFDWLANAATLIMNAFRPLGAFFADVFDAIIAKVQAFYDKVAFVINGIKSLLPSMEGSGTGSDPEAQGTQRRNFGGRGALGGFGPMIDPDAVRGLGMSLPDVSGRMNGGNNITAPQTNTINNEITVNAPGSDPASVAAGTSSGVRQATDYMTTRLGDAGRLALGLGMSNPRIEAASQ